MTTATITAKTSTGVEVTLTPTIHEGYDDDFYPEVEFEMQTKFGEISGSFGEGSWGPSPANKSVQGVNCRDCSPYKAGGKKYTSVTLAIPKADFDAAIAASQGLVAERQAQVDAEHTAIESGDVKIELSYHDGEYLSGHTVHGFAAVLLKRIGLADDVSGWGVHVSPALVKALGESFSYPDAVAFAQPAMDAKQAKSDAKQRKLDEAIEEAKTTGKRVQVETWSDDCCDPTEECSLDIVTRWANPDGTFSCTRQHTW